MAKGNPKVKLGADTSQYTRAMRKAAGEAKDFGSVIGRMGPMLAGAFSAGAIIEFGRQSFQAFEESEKASRRLLQAVNGNQQAYKNLQTQASALRDATGIEDEAISQVQMLGISAGHSMDMVKKITQAAVELSAVTGQDLQGAFMLINQTFNGTAGRLGRLSPAFKELTEDQLRNGAAVDLIIEKYDGMAEASATASQKLKTSWGEIKETIGGAIATVINPALDNLNARLRALKDNRLNWEQKDFFFANPEMYKQFLANEKQLGKLSQAFINNTKNILGYNIASRQKAQLEQQAAENQKALAEAEKQRAEALRKAREEQQAQLEAFRKQGQLWDEQQELMELQTETLKKYKEELKNMPDVKPVEVIKRPNIPMPTTPGLGDENPVEDINFDTQKIFNAYKSAEEFTEGLNTIIETGMEQVAMTFAEGIANMLTGEMTFDTFLSSILSVVGEFMKIMGQAMLAYALTMEAFKKAFADPTTLIILGAALIVAGGVVSALASKGLNGEKMAQGGIVPSGFPNDTYPALLSSGETVIPASKPLSGMMDEVVVYGRLYAGDIYLSNQRGSRIMQRRG